MNEQSQALPHPFDFGNAFELGKKHTFSTEYKGIPIYGIPKDMELRDLEHLVEKQLPRPYRLEQKVELLTEESFIEYYNRFATDSSTIFFNDENSQFVAVLDYHDAPDAPAWKHHRAWYNCPQTKEWSKWIKHNEYKFSQEEFAYFIEENFKEIIEPNAVDMLQIACSLKATNEVDFKSALRLDNGELQFNYVEKINGQAGQNGQMKIPEKIKLAVAPYLHGAAYEMEARFRYRITPHGLTMWYSLIRPHAYIQDALTDITKRVGEKMKCGQMLHGKI